MKKPLPRFELSSGNVFADLGFEHPEEELAKAQLIFQIVELIRARGLFDRPPDPILEPSRSGH
jgi:predicted XRE-type DNA-binding protein